MAQVASLVGDPGRANMLAALMDGRAHTASELAGIAGLAGSTASEHLAKLSHGRLVEVAVQGRHRYFRLASPHVAQLLESLMIVAGGLQVPQPRATPRVAPAMRFARSCYDHLAGELGVAITDALVSRKVVAMSSEGAAVTPEGYTVLSWLGIDLRAEDGSQRPVCRACLDWTERRPHLAGRLGAALFDRSLAVGWVKRQPGTRALLVNANAGRELARAIGLRR